MAQVAAGYAAKVAASALFVSGRTLESVLAEELAPERPIETLIRPLLRFDVDRERRTLTARLGPASATAVALAGLGCTLSIDAAKTADLPQRGSNDAPDVAPTSDPLLVKPNQAAQEIDRTALAKAVDDAFLEREGAPRMRTRAIVVLHRGRLVAERYAEGYDAQMPLPGWSMTKTMVNALVGVRVRQGKMLLAAPLATPAWPDDDPRRPLQLRDLMTMTSGLSWSESYDDPASNALQMLFGTADQGAVQAAQPLAHAPGEVFRYSSGSTNLICRELRATFANDRDYWAAPRTELFTPLGMHTAVLETDASGTFVGSSYGFASARDWARFGLLYANDGMVGPQRILPAGWVASSAQATAASAGRYGHHLWLNADPDDDGPRQRAWPDLPPDLMHMDGHEGQYVLVAPSEQVVIVRLGCTKAGRFDVRSFARAILQACTAH